MYLSHSVISCGVYQLDEVGIRPSIKAYKECMTFAHPHAFQIASIPIKWKRAIKFLNKIGFKQAEKPCINPNSKNKIIVLVKRLSKSEQKKIWQQLND